LALIDSSKRYQTLSQERAMHGLPLNGLLRLKQIVGDQRANPPIAPLIPVSAATWWAGVKSGRYPAPIRLGPRILAWRAADILELIERGTAP
jgi:prophage regulatory protein